jgi:hypothetical protein
VPRLPSIRLPYLPWKLRVLLGCVGVFGGFALLILSFATHSLLLAILAVGGIGPGVATLLFPNSPYEA